MLKKEITKQENAVETLFCKPFENLERIEMTEELSLLMLKLLFAEDFIIPDNKKPFLFQVIEKRIKHCFTFNIKEHSLILFLCALTEVPGQAIMYLTYLQYWCKSNNIKELTFDIFCDKIFPIGFPKKKDLSDLWYKVKVQNERGSDNLLDYQSALISIQFK